MVVFRELFQRRNPWRHDVVRPAAGLGVYRSCYFDGLGRCRDGSRTGRSYGHRHRRRVDAAGRTGAALRRFPAIGEGHLGRLAGLGADRSHGDFTAVAQPPAAAAVPLPSGPPGLSCFIFALACALCAQFVMYASEAGCAGSAC